MKNILLLFIITLITSAYAQCGELTCYLGSPNVQCCCCQGATTQLMLIIFGVIAASALCCGGCYFMNRNRNKENYQTIQN